MYSKFCTSHRDNYAHKNKITGRTIRDTTCSHTCSHTQFWSKLRNSDRNYILICIGRDENAKIQNFIIDYFYDLLQDNLMNLI